MSWREDKYYDTKTEKIGWNYYCVYCGEQAVEEEEIDDRELHRYHHCDCDNAKAEREFNKKIREISNEYAPKLRVNETVLNQLKYDFELKQLKGKYKIL